MDLPTTPTQCYTLLALASSVRQEKYRNGRQLENEEIKISPVIDKMIGSVESLKETTKKFLKLIGDFSKVSGYKIDIEDQVFFLIY